MEQYYEHRLLGIAHSYSSHLQIARRFLCPSWDAINTAEIRQTELTTEYMVPSQEKGIDLFYIRVVAAKYHIGSLNFLPSLTPNDLARFAYIAHRVVADNSFYALLHAQTNYSQHENYNYTKILHDKIHELEGSNTKNDYENSGPQLQASLEKLAKVLTSFLHNIKPNNDPLARVKSGAKIHVQVESVNRQKKEVGTKNSKENVDPHIIPACKVRAVSKKKHNISQNISKDQMN
ncbi:26359_t:CDS:2 [Gigaspora margarita]|uniref:26359_t:CDS:1 n=1 Tax=Gigaspora margarita TaxID=4874 RepID=A0ABN7VIE3_GIGMA|nr:26359_t:CDS:2 [Gigaspora margarita]